MAVKSAERSLRVFELLAQHKDGLTIKEISALLGFPQSSTVNLVGTLYREDYLSQYAGKRYKLGAKLIQLGTMAMESMDVASLGKPFLTSLMEDVQETVFMSVLSEGELVYIAKIDNNRSIRTAAQPGYRKPLYCTGLGKAYLAFMPSGERNAMLSSTELVPVTAHTITDRKLLEQELDRYREQGYAIDNEENEEGLYCLAAPVYGADRRIQAAVSVAGPKERMIHRKDFIVERLLYTVGRIARSIGY
ncbi:MAG: transcriptional regulator, IclR family [Paenibacillaceae bacterium]|jgi:DNA-binding IclR family transcriptional regulator|nr:transcriptional regulator, IclR family [Paenibacillaceae bacterium]